MGKSHQTRSCAPHRSSASLNATTPRVSAQADAGITSRRSSGVSLLRILNRAAHTPGNFCGVVRRTVIDHNYLGRRLGLVQNALYRDLNSLNPPLPVRLSILPAM